DLERRVIDFEQRAQVIAQSVGQLHQRVVGATMDLEQRLGVFDAHKQTIEQALGESSRVMDVLSGLESQVTRFAGRELEQAHQQVGLLEHRAADATAALERRASDFGAQIER